VPRLKYILLAQFAGVFHQGETQSFLVGAAEFVNAGTGATFRIHSPRALKSDRIAGNGVRAPRIPLAVMPKIDIERPVGSDHPDRAERIRPSSDQCRLPSLWVSRAGTQRCQRKSR